VQFTATAEFEISVPDGAFCAGATRHPASTVTLTDNEPVAVAAEAVWHRIPACRAKIPAMGTIDLASIVLPPVPGFQSKLIQCASGKAVQTCLLLEPSFGRGRRGLSYWILIAGVCIDDF